MKINHILLLLFLSCSIFSCLRKEKYSKVEVEGTDLGYALPLVNSRMTINDIVYNIQGDHDLYSTEDDGTIIFIYNDTIVLPKAENVIHFPEQEFHKNYNLDAEESIRLSAGETIEAHHSDQFDFGFENNAYLKYADLKAGKLNISLSSDLKHDIEIEITFNSLKKNNIPLKVLLNLDYSGNTPVTTNQLVDLNGYRLELSNGNEYNKFKYEVNVKATSSGQPASSANNLDLDLGIRDVKYSLLYGNPGVLQLQEEKGTVDIELFQSAINGNIYLEDPRITVNIANSYGVPVFLNLEDVYTENYAGERAKLTAPFVPGPTEIEYPPFTQRNTFKHTILKANKENSNLRDLINITPSKLNYLVKLLLGKETGSEYFVTDNSSAEVYIQAELPAYGRVSLYSIADTIRNIELPERNMLEFADLNYAQINLKVENSLPVGVSLQGYWLAPDGQVLDSLFNSDGGLKKIISAGNRASDGSIIPITEKTELKVDGVEYDRITKADKIVLIGSLQTTNGGQESVRFYNHDHIRIQLSIRAKARINIE